MSQTVLFLCDLSRSISIGFGVDDVGRVAK